MTVQVIQPTRITPFVVPPSTPVVIAVQHGKPQVHTYSTCADRGLPRDCRGNPVVATRAPVTKPVAKIKKRPRLLLPFGR